MEGQVPNNQISRQKLSPKKSMETTPSHLTNKQNQVGTVMLYGVPIVSLIIESQERLCLAQISNTLLKQYSYNEIHNRRVALGITCVQCTPVQLEILRRAGAMPVSSRRCGMITRREAERLCKSFLGDNAPPRLPDDFAFSVHHECAWGCRGAFLPSRYNSSRAKCIKCTFCGLFFSPNKFIFHSHRTTPNATYVQPDAANFNSWRRHMKLSGAPPDDVVHAWEDVKAMFNGGTRKRLLASTPAASSLPIRSSMATSVPIPVASPISKQIKLDSANSASTDSSYSSLPASDSIPISAQTSSRVPPFPDLTLPISMMDYVWHNGMNASDGIKHFPFAPYAVPWLENAKRSVLGLSTLTSVGSHQESLLQHLCSPNNADKIYHHSAFRPVFSAFARPEVIVSADVQNNAIKRQIHSDEFPVPKKRCSKELDDSSQNYFAADGDDCDPNRSRFASTDKENDSKTTEKNGVFVREFGSGNSIQNGGAKMTFERESINGETSNETEQKSVQKTRGKSDGKEFVNVTKFLSLRPAILDKTNMFRFREFSPNLLEAISNLKTEDRESHNVGHINNGRIAREECRKRKLVETEEDGTGRGDEEEQNGEEADDSDEPVDVESTDDLPAGFRVKEPEAEDAGSRNDDEKTDKGSRIWTVAKF